MATVLSLCLPPIKSGWSKKDTGWMESAAGVFSGVKQYNGGRWGTYMAMTALPPGPKQSWFGGNLSEFRNDRLEFLADCARKYGDAVTLRLAHRNIVLLSHPDLIEEVLVTHSKNFRKHFAL